MHTPVDIALVLLYSVVWLVVEMVRLPGVRARMAAAPPGERAREYVKTIVTQWTLAGLVFAWLAFGHVTPAAIGLALPHGAVAWGASGLALALVLWLTQAQAKATRTERGRAAIARALSNMAWMLPRDRREFTTFSLLSFTAGVCEEVLFRGHLLAVLDGWMGPALATAAGVAVFALAHAYQGKAGMVRVAMIGLFMALVYRATGSLLAPIVAHALIDFRGGRMVEAVVRQGFDLSAAPAPGPAPAGG